MSTMVEVICSLGVGASAAGRARAGCYFCEVGRELLSGPSMVAILVGELLKLRED